MKVELNSYQGDSTNQDIKQKRLSDLNSSLSQACIVSSKIEDKYQKTKERMSSLMAYIENAFESLECSTITPTELCLSPGEITEDNILLYLKIIEKRNMDILIALSELIKEKEQAGEYFEVIPDTMLAQIDAAGKSDSMKLNSKKLYNKSEAAKSEINSEDLFQCANINDFRKKLESKIKTSTKIDEI